MNHLMNLPRRMSEMTRRSLASDKARFHQNIRVPLRPSVRCIKTSIHGAEEAPTHTMFRGSGVLGWKLDKDRTSGRGVKVRSGHVRQGDAEGIGLVGGDGSEGSWWLAMVSNALRDSSGGVAEKMASTPFGRTSVHTNLDRTLACSESPLFVSIHLRRRGRLPVHRIASATVAYW